MNIKIYKTNNCKNCEILLENLNDAIKEINKDIKLEICTSIIEMSKKEIIEIPALEIDNEIISQGKVYSKEDLIKILENKSIIKKENFENHDICDEKGCRLNGKK